MEKVYRFTNENITSFESLYNFYGAKVLSVLGSGDQYFSSLLFGSSKIELYDINELSWDFFVLKYYGILIFDYEEFYDYFVAKKLDDYNYFKKIKCSIPYENSEKLESLYRKNGKLSSFIDFADSGKISYNDGSNIPYFNIEEYNRLKKILYNQNLPNFYLSDLADLPQKVSEKKYDILLASNIFYWMYLTPNAETEKVYEYRKLLEKFNCSEIQALYCWGLNKAFRTELLSNDFQISEIPSAKKLKLTNDYVVSYNKKI